MSLREVTVQQIPQERSKVPVMEGPMARFYAKTRGSEPQLRAYDVRAEELVRELPEGGRLLEVAPGPGYFAVALARTGRVRVSGLDISRSFVAMATERAHAAGVSADFRLGDVEAMPFADHTFDLIFCQAAFKNFRHPVRALDEMHRVLRLDGVAIVEDMSRDATDREIDEEVRAMELGAGRALMTRGVLRALRRRAAAPRQFEDLVARSAFHNCSITRGGIGMTIRMTKTAD
jgi:ubiquinone/menaquinone biosynthesis C-methylase UbiE